MNTLEKLIKKSPLAIFSILLDVQRRLIEMILGCIRELNILQKK
ncbi:MAG: hypothetical protein K0T53_00945 [Wolbachia pipientis]|nr:hypothetical protein [Wolbachia pipientis]